MDHTRKPTEAEVAKAAAPQLARLVAKYRPAVAKEAKADEPRG